MECLECKLQLHDNQVELLKAQWHFINLHIEPVVSALVHHGCQCVVLR